MVNFIYSLSAFYHSLPRISAGRYLTSGPATGTSDPRQNQNLSFIHVRPINNGREDNSLRSFWSGALKMIFGHDTSREFPELLLDLDSMALGQTVCLLFHTHIIYIIFE